MSRTDKDMPWWVVAEEFAPEHTHCPNAHRGWYGYQRDRECDLPAEPVRVSPNTQAKRTRRSLHCYWRPVWPWNIKYGNGRQGNPPNWYRLHYWYDPQRNDYRSAERNMIKEYRATGEVDTIPDISQHRHCAGWAWS